MTIGKKILALAISIIMLLPMISLQSVSAAETVTIPDAKLNAVLLTALGKDAGDTITKEELETITELDDSYDESFGDLGKISSLEGLQYCTNLRVLVMSNNNISDLNPIGKLTSLDTVALDHNKITNIYSISQCVNIRILVLDYNNILSTKGLKDYKKLQALSIVSSGLGYLDGLENLTSLRSIDISDNQVRTFAPLAELTDMIGIVAKDNWIDSVDELKKLTNLTYLDLSGNYILNISPLKALSKLGTLKLENQNVIYNNSISTSIFSAQPGITMLDGSKLGSYSVSNQGVYNSSNDTVTWNNISTIGTNYRTVSFNQSLNVGNAASTYSGMLMYVISRS